MKPVIIIAIAVVFGIISIAIIITTIEVGVQQDPMEIGVQQDIIDNVGTCLFKVGKDYSHLDKQAIEILCNKNFNLDFMSDTISTTDESHMNSEGFRGTEFSSLKSSDTYRIIVVGSSTVFGKGVSDDQTMPVYLQQFFDEQNIDFKVEVINVGLGGSWSKIETNLIKQQLVKYDPDLIIIYGGVADILVELGEILEHDPESGPIFWKNRLIDICNFGKDENFQTVIILQPILGSSERMMSDLESANNHIYNSLLNKIDNLNSYAIYLDEINQYCAGTKDFRGIFDHLEEALYFDTIHVGSKGNQIIAKEVYNLTFPIINQNEISNSDLTLLQDLNSLDNNESQINLDLRFIGKDLSGDSFSGQDLQNSVFRHSTLTNANFKNSNLQYADFSYATLKNTIFQNSNLENVNFRFAEFENTKFIDTNIENSVFARASIINTDFSNMDFNNQYFANSFISHSNFTDSNFENVNFQGSGLTDVSFTRTNFKNADFSNAQIVSVDFTTANISGANFLNTRLYNSNLSDIDFTNVNFNSPRLAGSLLDNVNLKNTDLSGFDLSPKMFDKDKVRVGTTIRNVDLSNKDMTKMVFVKYFESEDYSDPSALQYARSIQPLILNSNLSGVDLSNADLALVTFSNVDLSNANLSNANLRWSLLEHIDLSNADLSGADLRFANFYNVTLTNTNLTNALIDDSLILKNTKINCVGHEICVD